MYLFIFLLFSICSTSFVRISVSYNYNLIMVPCGQSMIVILQSAPDLSFVCVPGVCKKLMYSMIGLLVCKINPNFSKVLQVLKCNVNVLLSL